MVQFSEETKVSYNPDPPWDRVSNSRFLIYLGAHLEGHWYFSGRNSLVSLIAHLHAILRADRR